MLAAILFALTLATQAATFGAGDAAWLPWVPTDETHATRIVVDVVDPTGMTATLRVFGHDGKVVGTRSIDVFHPGPVEVTVDDVVSEQTAVGRAVLDIERGVGQVSAIVIGDDGVEQEYAAIALADAGSACDPPAIIRRRPVRREAPPCVVPTLQINVDPPTLCAPGDVTVSWNASDPAASVCIEGVGTNLPAQGTKLIAGTAGKTLRGRARSCGLGPEATATIGAVGTVDAPTIDASGPTTFCAGGSVTLTASGGYSSYLWSNGATTQSIEVSSSGLFTVMGTGASGCTSPDSSPVAVTVNPPASASISASPTTINFGENSTLTLTVANASSWWISSALGSSASQGSGTNNGTFTVFYSADNNVGLDTITLTATNGCGSTQATTTILVCDLSATITPAGPTTFCDGGSVQLQGPAGMSAYEWFMNGVSVASTQSVSVNQAGSYTLEVTSANGCTGLSAPVVVTVNPLAAITWLTATPNVINFGDLATITFTLADADSWIISSSLGNSFSPGSGAGSGAKSVTYGADNFTGTDTVTVTATNGCGSTLQTVTIQVN